MKYVMKASGVRSKKDSHEHPERRKREASASEPAGAAPPEAGGPSGEANRVASGSKGDASPSSSSSPSRIDVRLEQILEEQGVGPLVREQFLTIDAETYTRRHPVKLVLGTFNANGKRPASAGDAPDLSTWLQTSEDADIYVAGFQEIVSLSVGNVLGDKFAAQQAPPVAEWECEIDRTLNGVTAAEAERLIVDGEVVEDVAGDRSRREYLPLLSKSMVGIHLSVWVRKRLLPHVHAKEATCVGSGVMRLLGNKGGVSARVRIFDTFLSLTCVHLSSGESQSDYLRRNYDVANVLQNCQFSAEGARPLEEAPRRLCSVLDSDFCFLLGDLNYRLNAPDEIVRDALRPAERNASASEPPAWLALLAQDQLRLAMSDPELLRGWQEAPVLFPPTFKYVKGTSVYVGDQEPVPSSDGGAEGDGDDEPAQKRRTPAWCDRILWHAGPSVDAGRYGAVGDIVLSDHKPVYLCASMDLHEYQPLALEAAVQRARRMADMKEMEGMPRLELAEQFVDFGTVAYDVRETRGIRVENAGPVDAHWHLSAASDIPPWLDVHPVGGKVAKGTDAEITLVVHIEGGASGAAKGIRAPALETILVLSVAGAGDKFISISAEYAQSSFGITLERLVEWRPPSEARDAKLAAAYAELPPGSVVVFDGFAVLQVCTWGLVQGRCLL